MTESFRTQDGRTLTYRRVGEGPLLVCHPGGPGYSSLEFDDLGGLVESRTLILLDPRGTGGSDAPADPRAYAASDYAADVDELREHLGEEQLDVLGFSHGGVVAIAYAAGYPTRVRRLVVADSLVRLHPEEQEELMSRHRDQPWYEDARRAVDRDDASGGALWPLYFAAFDERAQRYVDEHITPERPNSDALALFNENIADWDMRSELDRIRAPTLVITGEYDFICGPACANDIVEGIAGAELAIIEDSGHFTFIEQPDRFRTEVERFLA